MSLLAGVGETIMSGSLLFAIPLALLAGLVSFLSPCVVPLVPGYLSLITGLSADELGSARRGRRARVLAGTVGFTAGFSLLFVSYGLALGQIGRTLAEHQQTITRVLGILVIVMGVAFVGKVPWLMRDAGPHVRGRGGVWLSPALGMAFGLGWVPCVGPTLAAVQTLAFTEANAGRGALLSLAYSLGLGVPFIVIGLAFERSMGTLAWLRRHRRGIQQFGGVLLIVLGALLVSGLWDRLTVVMRIWISGTGVLL